MITSDLDGKVEKTKSPFFVESSAEIVAAGKFVGNSIEEASCSPRKEQTKEDKEVMHLCSPDQMA